MFTYELETTHARTQEFFYFEIFIVYKCLARSNFILPL